MLLNASWTINGGRGVRWAYSVKKWHGSCRGENTEELAECFKRKHRLELFDEFK